jgi:heme/copper-type cytochrome/quinol oxidase subunit 2
MKSPFALEKKITIGELMTVISILVSAISVLITWRYEQKIKLLENATRKRIEIARTLNTVNQVIQIHLSFYELIEEDIVETSHICIEKKNPIQARDYIWEKFYQHRAGILSTLAQNDWEVAYTNLLSAGITADSLYIRSINRLKGLQQRQFEILLRDFESSILSFDTTAGNVNELTDMLRELKNAQREMHLAYTRRATEELNSFCLKLIKSTDKHLLFASDTMQ